MPGASARSCEHAGNADPRRNGLARRAPRRGGAAARGDLRRTRLGRASGCRVGAGRSWRRALGGTSWDAVIDLSSTPAHVYRAARGLRCGLSVLVSTTSVSAVNSVIGAMEDAELLAPSDDPASYGAAKVACEQAVLAGAAPALIARAGLIGGPCDRALVVRAVAVRASGCTWGGAGRCGAADIGAERAGPRAVAGVVGGGGRDECLRDSCVAGGAPRGGAGRVVRRAGRRGGGVAAGARSRAVVGTRLAAAVDPTP